jgi:hypothetical protein
MAMKFAELKDFAVAHATCDIQGTKDRAAFVEYFAEHYLPRLIEAAWSEDTMQFDKSNPEYRAARIEYKNAVTPLYAEAADPIIVNGQTITGIEVMMSGDEYRKLNKGALKTAIKEARERIQNDADQNWKRLFPKMDKPKPATTWQEDVTTAMKPLKSDGKDGERDAKRTAAGVTYADIDVAMVIATVGFDKAMAEMGYTKAKKKAA